MGDTGGYRQGRRPPGGLADTGPHGLVQPVQVLPAELQDPGDSGGIRGQPQVPEGGLFWEPRIMLCAGPCEHRLNEECSYLCIIHLFE